MRPWNQAIAILLALLGIDRALTAEPPLVIANVTVIDGTGAASKPKQTVVISSGKIVAIGDAGQVALPEKARTIDAAGQFLIPGLWDMHIHLTGEHDLDLCLAHGVTGVRNMFSFYPLYKANRPKGEYPAGRPRLVIGNAALDGVDTGFPRLARTRLYMAKTPADARFAVGKIKESGDDFVKIFSTLPRDAYFAAVDEAKKIGIPFAGHVPFLISASEASDAGQRSIEHMDGIPLECARNGGEMAKNLADAFRERAIGKVEDPQAWRFWLKAHEAHDPEKAKALFAKFVKNGTWQCPTLVESHAKSRLADETFINDPRLEQLSKTLRAVWRVEKSNSRIRVGLGIDYSAADLDGRRMLIESELKMLCAMHKAGVPILAGTDAPNPYCFPGSGVHDELELLVKAGLTPMEALQTATRNPARFLGREKELGTIEVGKFADLVLLDANPLEKIGNVRSIAGVVSGGRLLTTAELKELKLATKR